MRAIALAVVLIVGAGCAARADTLEEERILELLELSPGTTVADVGAGNGEWTVPLAGAVGESGHVWATEVDEERITAIERRISEAGLTNVTAVLGDQESIGLPDGCCDAILLRLVYHHFTDPRAMRASLRRALRTDGRLLVVDIEPQAGWRELPGVPDRGGHGIARSQLVEEMVSEGFVVLEEISGWNGDDDRYAVVFRPDPTRP